MQKKSKKNFSNCKNTCAKKKHEISFQKNMQKKIKMQKGTWGVVVIFYPKTGFQVLWRLWYEIFGRFKILSMKFHHRITHVKRAPKF